MELDSIVIFFIWALRGQKEIFARRLNAYSKLLPSPTTIRQWITFQFQLRHIVGDNIHIMVSITLTTDWQLGLEFGRSLLRIPKHWLRCNARSWKSFQLSCCV